MLNALIRLGYRSAHLLIRIWWFFRRPRTHGVFAAVWVDGQVLLARNSYRRGFTLPGGSPKPAEFDPNAAARELREEVGVVVAPKRFRHAHRCSHSFEFRKDTVDIYQVELDALPELHVDEREVIWAGWNTPAEALQLELLPYLRDYLGKRYSPMASSEPMILTQMSPR